MQYAPPLYFEVYEYGHSEGMSVGMESSIKDPPPRRPVAPSPPCFPPLIPLLSDSAGSNDSSTWHLPTTAPTPLTLTLTATPLFSIVALSSPISPALPFALWPCVSLNFVAASPPLPFPRLYCCRANHPRDPCGRLGAPWLPAAVPATFDSLLPSPLLGSYSEDPWRPR